MAGVFQRFGASAGSGSVATLIPIDTIAPSNTNQQIRITDFGVAVGSPAAESVIFLELSDDGFSGSIVEVSRIEVPTTGTIYKTFGRPIRVTAGQSLRARFSQGTPGPISGELFGDTATADVADI
jgi:hypothetical protein